MFYLISVIFLLNSVMEGSAGNALQFGANFSIGFAFLCGAILAEQ